MIELRISKTVTNKKTLNALDAWMIWDFLMFVDQNRNRAKYIKHDFKV